MTKLFCQVNHPAGFMSLCPSVLTGRASNEPIMTRTLSPEPGQPLPSDLTGNSFSALSPINLSSGQKGLVDKPVIEHTYAVYSIHKAQASSEEEEPCDRKDNSPRPAAFSVRVSWRWELVPSNGISHFTCVQSTLWKRASGS